MGTLQIPTIGQKGNTEHPKVNAAIEALNAILGSENKVKGAGVEEGQIEGKHVKDESLGTSDLAKAAKPVTWYEPKVIATEETRESASYGTLTTKDEITGVVLPANGIMLIGYLARVSSSAELAGRAAIFIGANQLKLAGAVQECTFDKGVFKRIGTAGYGLNYFTNPEAFATTGEVLSATASTTVPYGLVPVFANAGTYTVSVQYKATSGSITAKERKLWVCTLGY